MEYIIKPCDWETVYLNTETDANKFGEALREYCFIGNCMETGCYSTFNLQKCFKKLTEGDIFEEAKKYLYEDTIPTVYCFKLDESDCYIEFANGSKKSKICEPTEIVIGWTWDGDGCLYFRWNNRKVINYDCKCDYTWEWIK